MGARGIEGLLIDVEGVLHVDGSPLPGAVEALRVLARAGIPYVLLTNTTSRTRRQLGVLLRELGFPIEDDRILTAAAAAAEYVRRAHPGEPCYLLVDGELGEEFSGVPLTEGDDARVVVVGGAGDSFTYARVNRAFRLLSAGAAFVAMHKNLVWQRRDGLVLDAGAYIVGLEAATGRDARVVGKPSTEFFRAGLELLGLPPERVAMVGDSLDHDVLPAQRLGMAGILVRTGLGRAATSAPGQARVTIDAFADLPSWLGLRRSGDQ